MVRAKNYETVSTFVEVMQKKPWPLFSVHGVYPKWLEIRTSNLAGVLGSSRDSPNITLKKFSNRGRG